jgi:Family of unknown function (DUF5829)
VPWFEMTYVAEISGLPVFVMEYRRDFLSRWYANLTPARSIARADVLDRYVAKIGASDRRDSAQLKDVTGLTIALLPAERETLAKQLRAAGWTAQDDADSVLCTGPESVRIRLAAHGAGRTGVVAVDFSLQHPAQKATHRVGNARLRLEETAARLRFDGTSASR